MKKKTIMEENEEVEELAKRERGGSRRNQCSIDRV